MSEVGGILRETLFEDFAMTKPTAEDWTPRCKEIARPMTAEDERAAVVAWLRRREEECENILHSEFHDGSRAAFGVAADAIENGDHHKGE